MFQFTSEWKLEMFGKSLKEIEIVVQVCCLHTPFKGEAICEYQVEKHKNPKNCPSYSVWKKGYKDIDQWMLGWDIHAKPTKLPQFWYTQRFWSNNGFYFRIWGFISIGGEKFMWNSQNCPSFGVWRRIWMNEGCCFKRGSGNEGLGEKDCPSRFIFFSLAFGQIIGCSLLHEKLFFFHFFFTFEINSLVWSIYWKTFYFISFEALSKQHVWNFRWLRRGWMRWRGPTRELTQFDLVLGHQECLGLPQLLMTWRKMIWTSKVDPVWEYGLASGYKMCLTTPFINERVRQIKKDFSDLRTWIDTQIVFDLPQL